MTLRRQGPPRRSRQVAGLGSRSLALCAALVAAGALTGSGRVGADETGPAFVGSARCQACHPAQHGSWARTRMARAFDLLAPGAEEKVKVGLDPRVDHRGDRTCLPCHTVGFGLPGGFRPDMDRGVAGQAGLLGVGCEACHGAAGAWLGEGLHDEGLADPEVLAARRPLLAELGAVRSPPKERCVACHNEASPTVQPFDYERRRAQVTHEPAEPSATAP